MPVATGRKNPDEDLPDLPTKAAEGHPVPTRGERTAAHQAFSDASNGDSPTRRLTQDFTLTMNGRQRRIEGQSPAGWNRAAGLDRIGRRAPG